jgi:thiamine biosynthesis protein ThiS
MKITLNGEQREISGEPSLLQFLADAGFAEKRIAVEINRRIVPRSTFADQRIHEGDRIEIVHAIGGG